MAGGTSEHFDVLIVGAGISGIGAACHLQDRCPDKSYAILEARESLGGTWDFFRYPGLRSDSDMLTLGYRFKPWTDEKTITDGASILEYLREAASENGVGEKIRYQHQVVGAEWSSEDLRWEIEIERPDTNETIRLTCDFFWSCSGYYRYDVGHMPDFRDSERFQGLLVHPQQWPENLDYAGKRIVVIGSGATAVTLVPALAQEAAHVTMLQRSPTYIVTLPAVDRIAMMLRRILPERAAYAVSRWKNVFLGTFIYELSQRRPQTMRRIIHKGTEKVLPAGYDVDRHFNPRYEPWDQRICITPDGELFKAISDGDASVVTDEVATFTENGVELVSGEELEADIVIAATGLKLVFMGGVRLSVDGEEIDPGRRMAYKAMMLNGVPNCAFVIGYTNASWTLKADLVSEYVCRLLNHMDAHGYRRCVPEIADPTIEEKPLIEFDAGYVLRALDDFPSQGSKDPWRLKQNYTFDVRKIRRGPIEDGTMRFSSDAPQAREAQALSA